MGEKITFGFREIPRPRGHGYLYCELPGKRSEIILAFLDLYAKDEEQTARVFSMALGRIRSAMDLPGHELREHLTGYSTDNMGPAAQGFLARAIAGFLSSSSLA